MRYKTKQLKNGFTALFVPCFAISDGYPMPIARGRSRDVASPPAYTVLVNLALRLGPPLAPQAVHCDSRHLFSLGNPSGAIWGLGLSSVSEDGGGQRGVKVQSTLDLLKGKTHSLGHLLPWASYLPQSCDQLKRNHRSKLLMGGNIDWRTNFSGNLQIVLFNFYLLDLWWSRNNLS